MLAAAPPAWPNRSLASFSCHRTAYGMTGMASSASTRRLTGARRQPAAAAIRTAAISRSPGRPVTSLPRPWVKPLGEASQTLPPTLNPPSTSAPAPISTAPPRVSRARPRSGPGEISSAAAAAQASRTVNATTGLE